MNESSSNPNSSYVADDLLQHRKSGLSYRTLLVFSNRRLTEDFAVKKNTRDTGAKEYLGIRGNGVVLDLLQVRRCQF